VIDFPFDEAGRSPEDDLERLGDWASRHEPSNTVCWLPSFFHNQGVSALREYVAVSELMKLDRFDQHTTHLSPNQRMEAKPILEARENQLRSRLHEAMLTAYGVVGGTADPLVDPANSLNDHYRTLHPALAIRPTTHPTLDGAMGQLCDQIFDNLYPGHPEFEANVTPGQLRTTWTEIRRALPDPDLRVVVETAQRKAVRNVANSTGLGTMHESHFVVSRHWQDQLDRHLSGGGTGPEGAATVADARTWIDDVAGGPRGLEPAVADLIILTVAALSDHRLVQAGRAYDGDAGKAMPGEVLLVPEELPATDTWERAIHQAGELFGKTFSKRVTGPELTELGNTVRAEADTVRANANLLAEALTQAYKTWGLSDGARLATARANRDLVNDLAGADDNKTVELLAAYQSPGSPDACSRSLNTAGTVAAALGRANLGLWDTARSVVGDDVQHLLTSEEVVVEFEATELVIEQRATEFIIRSQQSAAPTTQTVADAELATAPEPTGGPPVSAGGNHRIVATEAELQALTSALADAIDEHGPVTVTWAPSNDA
jgi:hypothetical protein